MVELRIQPLGGFRVQVGPREIAEGERRLRKARSLVKLLAPAPGHGLLRAGTGCAVAGPRPGGRGRLQPVRQFDSLTER